MNRTDRLTGILLALRGGPTTAARLAARFEVSRRTILRDLEALGQLGVPIVATPGNGGGVALPEDYWLPPLRLSATEATAVLLGLAALGPADSSPFGEPRRSAEEKIRAAIDPDTLRASERALGHVRFESPPTVPGADHVDAIRRAIADGQWLHVDYRSTRRVAGHDLLPRELAAAGGHWYVVAVSYEARQARRYRIDRIEALRRIPAPPDADAVVAAADATPAYHDDAHPEVVIHLSAAGVTRAPDVFGVRLDATAIGDALWELRFRCPPSELPFYARCVLSLGDDARALGPPGLVDRVRDVALRALERHRSPETDHRVPISKVT